MPSRTNTARWTPPALALLVAAAMPGAARAVPPSASDFQITYRFTDDDGNVLPSQRLTQNDLDYYVNQARCQCGERISARVFLQPSQSGPYDSNFVRTFVGSNCDLGQAGNNQQYGPCAMLTEELPLAYGSGGREVGFDLVWLSSSAPGINENVSTIEPVNPCASGQSGNAGLWVCLEDGMATDCQSNEFIITGTQNENGTTGGTTGTTPGDGSGSGGIRFDYLPPVVSITGIEASPGDGRIIVTWDRTNNTDVRGFRVLCADLEGNPVPGKGASEPTGSNRTLGELYFTAENLCPGEVVYEVEDGGTLPPFPRPEDTDTDTGGSDEGTTSAGAVPWYGGGLSTGFGTDTDGTGSGSGGTSSGTDGTSSGGSGSGTDGGITDSPLMSLDWAYVCSDHISVSGTTAEINGLRNGTEYQLLLVAYDRAGNPAIVSEVLTEMPAETTDFWEQCEQQGDICGDGGFCRCRTGDEAPVRSGPWGLGLMSLLLLGLRRHGSRP